MPPFSWEIARYLINFNSSEEETTRALLLTRTRAGLSLFLGRARACFVFIANDRGALGFADEARTGLR